MATQATVPELASLCKTIRIDRRRLAADPLRRFLRVYIPTVLVLLLTLALVGWQPAPVSWITLAIVAGLTQNALGILTHEASHYFLHRDRATNDRLADWLVCLPIFNTVAGYRRGHLEHHRLCCGPLDPYYGLYGPYTKKREVVWGFAQDLVGLTAFRTFLARYAEKGGTQSVGTPPVRMAVVQGVIALALYAVTGHWWAYGVVWVGPLVTVPFAVNRIRTFVEHHADAGGPEATRTTRPTPLEWLIIAPYGYAHHFEHHLMPDIPYYHLGWTHEALVRQGFAFGDSRLSRGGYLRMFARLFKDLR